MANNDFKSYQMNSVARQPREQLVEFVKQHQQQINDGSIKNAVDLGCGGCVDTKYLASLGLNVLAVDGNIHSEVIDFVQNSTPAEEIKNITFSQQSFENLNLPKTDLLWSFASMPFCQKEHFAQMIANAVSSVNPNGYFVAQFFDKTHPFVTQGGNVGVDQNQIQELFNYLGFKADVTTFKSERTADGQFTENLNNVYVVAQAPEQLKEFSVDKISQILGLNPQQEINSTPNEAIEEQNLIETTSESNQQLNNEELSQPAWINQLGSDLQQKLLSTPEQVQPPVEPIPPAPAIEMEP